MHDKNLILFINSIHKPTAAAILAYGKKNNVSLQPIIMVDETIKSSIFALNNQSHVGNEVTVITADFASPHSIHHALKPYRNRILAFTSQFENSITEYKKLIPYLPYLPAPTESSLDWSTDKKLMRQAFDAYDVSLSPASIEVRDALPATIAAIEQAISFPMIIKPSGLERSLLVSVVRSSLELATTLAGTFEKLDSAYQTWMKRLEPTIIVEEFMSGDMYSVDSYVSADGTCRHAAPIKVITGQKIGFKDFFAYLQLSPAGLSQTEVAQAHRIAYQACAALGLRSVTAHTEMMKTPKGWKIIEVGPRIGGYRHELYALSHGMNHIANDVLNRAGLTPEIPAEATRHAAIYKTYARAEGNLEAIDGIDAIRNLSSYVAMKTPFKIGDALKFASNNGDAVIEVTLCNDDPAQLHSDIRTIEDHLDIRVKTADYAKAT